MRQWTDIQIRIRGAQQTDELQARHEVEALIGGAGVWTGESVFDSVAADPSQMNADAYGLTLGAQLINPAVGRALAYAGADAGRPVRIRLLVDEGAAMPQTIRWERMLMPVGTAPWPVAISPTVTFSRCIPVQAADSGPIDEPAFRLLIAVSNPANIQPANAAIDVESELGAIVDEFKDARVPPRMNVTVMPGRTGVSPELAQRIQDLGWTVEEGPTSLENIGAAAGRRRCHGIHLLAHGDFKAGKGQGIVYLETADGNIEKVVDDRLKTWVSPLLRLAVFQSCRTAASGALGQPPFVGVAARMIRFGVPAVVAMQDFVAIEDARVFVVAFYRTLMEEGQVDTAVNAGRSAIASRDGDWSIPALFQRLSNAQLWSPDPVREAVWENRVRICSPPAMPEALPLSVVHECSGIAWNALNEPSGPVFTLAEHARELLGGNKSVCLTGPTGSNKTAQLQRLFCLFADDYLKDSSKPAPVWLDLDDLALRRVSRPAGGGEHACSRAFEDALNAVVEGKAVPQVLTNRKLVFLVDNRENLSVGAMRTALPTLRRLLQALEASCLFVFDASSLDALRFEFKGAAVLVVRPLDVAAVRMFLTGTGRRSDNTLSGMIERCCLYDLAATPWLLTQMRDLVSFGYDLTSRAAVVERVADNLLGGFGAKGIPRSAAIQALRCIAWTIHENRASSIPNQELWSILDRARASRDFRLSEFRDALVDSRLLVPVGEEESCIPYKHVCAYFAACYLMNAPNCRVLLEDITASLGRLTRLRHWEETLLLYAGLQRTISDRERLLQVLLAGSSLMEGEQVFLAAELFVEMRHSANGDEQALLESRVVRQVVDTLIWRSRPDLPRPYQDRRRTVERLASMRHPAAVPHLVCLACNLQKIPFDLRPSNGSAATAMRYDFSGIRLLAVRGLFDQPQATEEFLKTSRPDLMPLFHAWEDLAIRRDDGAIVALLRKNDPAISPVAAFAFALEKGTLKDCHPLLDAFWDESTDDEVRWGITEVLGAMDAAWLQEHVILPWIESNPAPNGRLCYLIQKSAFAPAGSMQRTYLEACLRKAATSDRAVRALAKFRDAEMNGWLRGLCHDILNGQWSSDLCRRLEVPAPPAGEDEWRMQHAALEALRDIGDESSVELLRSVRPSQPNVLAQLSFQVGEEIYWRLTGGLTREYFDS